ASPVCIPGVTVPADLQPRAAAPGGGAAEPGAVRAPACDGLFVAKPSVLTVGLISDTHGLLRPQAVEALQGVDRIIHAGDIGGEEITRRSRASPSGPPRRASSEILAALRALAPVDAVRGNNDRGSWAERIPTELTLEVGGVAVHVLHDLKELEMDPVQAGVK